MQKEQEQDRDQKVNQEQPVLLTVAQVSRIINMGRSKTYELISANLIPSIAIGRSRRVLREDLMAWIEKQRSWEGNNGR